MQKIILPTLFFLLSCLVIQAQELNIGKLERNGKDTLAVFQMDEVMVFADKSDRLAFERMKRNTIKVYPYVKMAVQIFNEMNEDMSAIDKKRKQKRYVKAKEEILRAQLEAELRDLTKAQGGILIKLINRETGNNCYQIIKDLKNPITAFFYNAVGKHYGYNLKEEYYPEENQNLELIFKALKNEQPCNGL